MQMQFWVRFYLGNAKIDNYRSFLKIASGLK